MRHQGIQKASTDVGAFLLPMFRAVAWTMPK